MLKGYVVCAVTDCENIHFCEQVNNISAQLEEPCQNE